MVSRRGPRLFAGHRAETSSSWCCRASRQGELRGAALESGKSTEKPTREEPLPLAICQCKAAGEHVSLRSRKPCGPPKLGPNSKREDRGQHHPTGNRGPSTRCVESMPISMVKARCRTPRKWSDSEPQSTQHKLYNHNGGIASAAGKIPAVSAGYPPDRGLEKVALDAAGELCTKVATR
jgi:hypothetical protein